MKKTLLTILSFAALLGTQAQVTITSADFPIVGTSVVLINDTLGTGLTIGGAGAGQTWDLTGITQHTIDTTIFVDPTTTTNGILFPFSTVALTGTQDAYFTNGSSQATADGFSGDPFNLGVTTDVVFTDKETLFTFPSSLNTSFNDSMAFRVTKDAVSLGLSNLGLTTNDSVRIIRLAITSSIIDAEGSVTTPGGTFPSIRQYKTQETIDSIFLYIDNALTAGFAGIPAQTWTLAPINTFIPQNPMIDTTFKYTWYTNGEGFAVAELELDTMGGSVKRAQYLYKNNLLGFAGATTQASCTASCDGTGEVSAQGGSSNYTFSWPNGTTTAAATGVCSGTNAVTISDGTTSITVMVEVTESTAWTASINAFENASCGTCTDGTATANANGGAAPYTYLWNDITSQTSATATGLVAGTYTCTITDANGCSAVTSSATVTRIDQEIINNLISVFPNPTTGLINISMQNIVGKKYVIYNTVGAIVSSGNIASSTKSIELNHLQNGLYFIEITSNKGIIKKKITVVK